MSGPYFSNLNYTLGDEDTWVEYHMLREEPQHVMCIAGSGGRALPLLARRPKKLTCVDILDVQLHLTELRLEALRRLDLPTYTSFLGYPPRLMLPQERRTCFKRLELSAEAQESLGTLFEKEKWGPIVYIGKFEKTLITLSKVVAFFTGKKGRAIFETQNMEAQQAYYHQHFPKLAWKLVLMLLGNSTVLNSLLYKGDFPKKNIPRSAYAIYADIFHRLLYELPVRSSFFLQLVFFGEVHYAEGNPIECDPRIFNKAKEALKATEVELVQGDVLEHADASVNFLSLSDVPSFFKGDLEQTYMQQLFMTMAPGSQVVYRGHLRLPNPDTSGFDSLASSFATVIEQERTQLWQIYPFRKKEFQHA